MHAGDRRILVVDSEPDRSGPIAAALSHDGLLATAVPSGAEALALCRRGEPPVHLVLTRIVLRTMSGLDLAEAIEREKLPVKILLISHYQRDVLATSQRFLKFSDRFIQNPVSDDQLRRRVCRELGLPDRDRAQSSASDS